jgi:hypothetical protein
MTPGARSLWPDRVRRPYLRLAAALIAAPLALAAILTGLAFLVAGSTEPTREAVMAVTRQAAVVFFVALPAFALTFGLAGVVALWVLALRGVTVFLLIRWIAGVRPS